ncbi:MAG TPA: DUF6279 family lipoprotein [Burkholderiales bacterium]|nr:DUF6279 family lipoprotein [Burkholderiales bacterium]
MVALVRVLLVCVLLGFSGCSTVRFAYNNADIYLRWQLGKYLDVQDAELEEVERHIAAFLAWHRANALPQYIRLVNEANSRFARGISREDLVWGYDSLQAQVLQAVRAAAGEMADLLDRLTPEQIAYMERRFAEDNRKYVRENVAGSIEERRRRRVKRNVERLEEWFGSLSEGQIERVRQYAERAPFPEAMRDKERKRLQSEFIEIVRAKQAKARFAQWAVDWERRREPEHAAAVRAQRMEYFAMLVDLSNTLNPSQRDAVDARFRELASDFERLARK